MGQERNIAFLTCCMVFPQRSVIMNYVVIMNNVKQHVSLSYLLKWLFCTFLPGQRDTQILLDSESYFYSRKKDKDTALNNAWRCSKNRSLKCDAMVFLDPNNSLSITRSKPHNHAPNNIIEEKATFFASLKRKAPDQRISATQNIVLQ